MNIIAKGAVVLLTIICAVFVSAAQDKLRQMEQPAKYVYPDNPVEIIVTSVADKPLINGQIMADSNWLRNLNLKIKNVSGKDIKWIEMNLILREDGPGLSRIVLPVYFGETKPDKIPVVLAAGKMTTLQPRQDDVDFWVRYCKNQGIEDIDRIILDIRRIRFTDDTGWYVGIPTIKDPTTNYYRPVNVNEPDPALSIFASGTNLIIQEPTPVFFSALGT